MSGRKTTLVLLLLSLFPKAANGEAGHPFGWNHIPRDAYPGAFWWWPGSAVSAEELDRQITSLADVGIKTLRLNAIYRGKGSALPTIDYLSDPWNQAAKMASEICASRGVQLDLWGNGWPFGGGWIRPEHAARRLEWDDGLAATLVTDTKMIEQDDGFPIFSVSVTPPGASDAQPATVLPSETIDGKKSWSVPPGEWDVHVFRNGYTKMDVKRAPPGGDGPVMDHFSRRALDDFLVPHDRLLDVTGTKAFRVVHNDSYEVHRANWTGKFVPFFAQKRGYDLTPYLPALISGADSDLAQRIRHDYRQTIQEILTDEMMKPWVQWAHGHGMKTSYQAHGSPGHLVDLYGLSDQPDTEAFGRLGMANDGTGEGSGYICSKFASSAAHLNARRLTSSETFTWLEDHFCVSLDRMRREIDYYFLAGVNRVYYHSTTFSPADVPFPGWLYYASTNVDPCQTWWKHLSHLNNYIARIQTVLQQGSPGEDILLLYPIHDLWFDNEGGSNLLQYCQVHNTANWLHRAAKPAQETAQWLWDHGWAFDWCSDTTICNSLRVEDGEIVAGDGRYRALIIPECGWVGSETPGAIRKLARQGAHVLILGVPPQPVPTGRPAERLPNWSEVKRKEAFAGATANGRVSFLESIADLPDALRAAGALREPMADRGLLAIRRREGNAYTYFIRNVNQQDFDDWLPLPGIASGDEQTGVVVGDPVSGDFEVMPTETRSGIRGVRVRIPASRACIVKSAPTPNPSPSEGGGESEEELSPADGGGESEERIGVVAIDGPWQLSWRDLEKPAKVCRAEMAELTSWTDREDLRFFSGTVAYETTFDLPQGPSKWRLDLGTLHESADVFINGKPMGCIWTVPYVLDVGSACQPGKNQIRIEVTNLTANRIIALEKSGVHIADRHLFVNYDYKPFDAKNWPPLASGLLGPVKLCGNGGTGVRPRYSFFVPFGPSLGEVGCSFSGR